MSNRENIIIIKIIIGIILIFSEEGKSMRRFQNATMEYNVAKNELVIRECK